jgi:hypothetical protein
VQQLHKATNIRIGGLGLNDNDLPQQHSDPIKHLVGPVPQHDKRLLQPILLALRVHLPQVTVLADFILALPVKFLHGPIHNQVQRDIFPKIRAVVRLLYQKGSHQYYFWQYLPVRGGPAG